MLQWTSSASKLPCWSFLQPRAERLWLSWKRQLPSSNFYSCHRAKNWTPPFILNAPVQDSNASQTLSTVLSTTCASAECPTSLNAQRTSSTIRKNKVAILKRRVTFDRQPRRQRQRQASQQALATTNCSHVLCPTATRILKIANHTFPATRETVAQLLFCPVRLAVTTITAARNASPMANALQMERHLWRHFVSRMSYYRFPGFSKSSWLRIILPVL